MALPTYGAGYELQTIAACVLGGTDLFGGTGKLSGVVIGVIILTMLSNILDLTGVNPFWNFIAIGAALWISVSFRSRLMASGADVGGHAMKRILPDGAVSDASLKPLNLPCASGNFPDLLASAA